MRNAVEFRCAEAKVGHFFVSLLLTIVLEPLLLQPGGTPGDQETGQGRSTDDLQFREDGRVYSVGLVVDAVASDAVLVGAKVVAQGRIARFGYADTKYGAHGKGLFAVVQDEQQRAKVLMCSIRGEEEAAEVTSLYHAGDVVGVAGEYLFNASIAGQPPMPILYDCLMAGPQKEVVRASPVSAPDARGPSIATSAATPCQTSPLGSGVIPPRAILAPDPAYSDEARHAGIQGKVVLGLETDCDGNVSSVSVVHSLEKTLDDSAVDTIRKWKFSPATKDGKAVSVHLNVEVSFRLDPAPPDTRSPLERSIYGPIPSDWQTTENGARITGVGWLEQILPGRIVISNLGHTARVSCRYKTRTYWQTGDKISVSLKKYNVCGHQLFKACPGGASENCCPDDFKCEIVTNMTR